AVNVPRAFLASVLVLFHVVLSLERLSFYTPCCLVSKKQVNRPGLLLSSAAGLTIFIARCYQADGYAIMTVNKHGPPGGGAFRQDAAGPSIFQANFRNARFGENVGRGETNDTAIESHRR
ncbi:MAG: hypothetical protein ACXW6R_26055, partial [Candidatus Binatia bacterium]